MTSVVRKAVLPAVLLGVSAVVAARLVRRGRTWGSSPAERALRLPGDEYLDGGSEARTAMTRAVSISAPPEVVWPWLAQMGRGAGWYSYDRADNGGRISAQHIVSWIPAPCVGDASALGWLRDLEPGRALTWWLPGDEAFGTTLRMVVDVRLDPQNDGSRLVIRVSGGATGPIGALVLRGFEAVDSLMAVRQLRGIKMRAEAFGARTTDHRAPETGDRAQYQEYEAVYASGERAGVPRSEKAGRWRQDAVARGVVHG